MGNEMENVGFRVRGMKAESMAENGCCCGPGVL